MIQRSSFFTRAISLGSVFSSGQCEQRRLNVDVNEAVLTSTETIVLLSSRDGLLRANILKHLGIVPFVLCGVNVIKLSSHDGQMYEPAFR